MVIKLVQNQKFKTCILWVMLCLWLNPCILNIWWFSLKQPSIRLYLLSCRPILGSFNGSFRPTSLLLKFIWALAKLFIHQSICSFFLLLFLDLPSPIFRFMSYVLRTTLFSRRIIRHKGYCWFILGYSLSNFHLQEDLSLWQLQFFRIFLFFQFDAKMFHFVLHQKESPNPIWYQFHVKVNLKLWSICISLFGSSYEILLLERVNHESKHDRKMTNFEIFVQEKISFTRRLSIFDRKVSLKH